MKFKLHTSKNDTIMEYDNKENILNDIKTMIDTYVNNDDGTYFNITIDTDSMRVNNYGLTYTENVCPLGGDITNDCESCVYTNEYHFVNGECRKRENSENDIENIYNELLKVIKAVIYYSKFKEYIHILPCAIRKLSNEKYHVDIVAYNIDLVCVTNELYHDWDNDKTISECMSILNDKIQYYDKFIIVKEGTNHQGFISLETK